MLLMAIFALAIYAEEQDTLDKAKFQAAVPYNQAVEIHFGEKTKMPTEYTQDKGDVSVAQNGKIHAYAADDGKYYIAHEEDGTIYFPEDSGYLFSDENTPQHDTKLTSITFNHIDTSKVTDMDNMFEECRVLTELDLSSFNTSKVTDMTDMFGNCKALTKLDLSSFDTSNVTFMGLMFGGCEALTKLDLSKFNTSKVTDMGSMFWHCSTLEELNVSSFNTSKVTNMRGMFLGCEALTTLDVSSFNTSKVTDMQHMFYGCKALTTLDVSKFDTSKVTNMRGMFNGCSALTKLDVSNFNTSEVANMGHMFEECTKLKTIYASKNFKTDNITMIEAGKDVFKYCIQLEGGKGTKYDVSHTGKEYARIDGGTSAPGYFTQKGSTPPSALTDTLDKEKFQAAVPYNQAVEIHFGAKTKMPTEYTQDKGDVSEAQNGKIHAYATADGKYYIAHEGNETIYFPEDSCYLFSDSDTEKSDCYTELKSITFDHIDTSKVIGMGGMFKGCKALKELNLSSFDTSKVTGMWDMFMDCNDLETLDVSKFNTGKVTNMLGMFHNCNALETLDVSKFDTSNVTNMACMFTDCNTLEELDLSSFDTSNVTDMGEMFSHCKALKELDLSSFDTSKVTDMHGMFWACNALEELDVSKFDTSKVTDMSWMFYDCFKLKTIYASENFKIDQVTRDNDMFQDCTELVGGNETKYDKNHIDKEYARIDGGTSAPGYFTEKGSTLPSVVTDTLDKNKFHTAVPCAQALEIHFGTKKDKPADYTTPKGDVSVAQNGKIRAYATEDGKKYYIAHEDNKTIYFPKDSEYLFSDEKIVQHYTKLNKITFNNHIDTSDVVNMAGMFYGCESLETLDVSKFNTSNVVNMAAMFNGCKALKTLDVSEFDTSNVTDMKYMFARCEALTTLDVSKFDTSKVINMESMFWSCKALTELDLSSFNTSNVTNIKSMFLGCIKLKTIYASENFNTDNITMIEAGKDVFEHCTQLEGGKGTTYDASHTGKDYARIDGGKDAPGYFTKKGSTPPLPKKYNITTNNDGNGTATATPNSAAKGTEITIEAIAKPNYKFVKWEGINGLELTYGNTNTAIVKFTMPDKDVTVKATFEKSPSTTHTIRFESNGGSGSMTAVTVGHGKNYTLPKCDFAAPEGKEFDHWEVKGTAYNVGGQITDIKDDLTIKAVWKKKSSGGSSGGGSSSGSSKKTDNTVKQEQPSIPTPQPSSDNNLAENPAKNNIVKKQQTTVFTIGSNIMTVMEDGKSKQTTIDAKSFLSQGRTMIPVRYVAESMGMKVEWDKKTMTVILKNKEMTVKIPVKTDKIIVIKADGTKQEYTSDIKPIVKNGRTYLPISNIAKVLDLKPGEGIKWDNNTKQVTIVKQIDIH